MASPFLPTLLQASADSWLQCHSALSVLPTKEIMGAKCFCTEHWHLECSLPHPTPQDSYLHASGWEKRLGILKLTGILTTNDCDCISSAVLVITGSAWPLLFLLIINCGPGFRNNCITPINPRGGGKTPVHLIAVKALNNQLYTEKDLASKL